MTAQAPRINHVALTVDRSLLEEPERSDIIDFYRTVFGWQEIPQMRIDGKRVVLSLYDWHQFLYLINNRDVSSMGRADHFGIEVYNRGAFDKIVEAAKTCRAQRGEGVEITPVKAEEFGEGRRLINAYVRYKLPLMVEIQLYEGAWPPAGTRA